MVEMEYCIYKKTQFQTFTRGEHFYDYGEGVGFTILLFKSHFGSGSGSHRSSIESNRTKVLALCKIILQFDCGLVVEMEHCIYKKPRFKLQ